MNTDKRLTATVPLIGMNDQWEERYLNDCLRMGADSVFLMAPYDNIVRSKQPVRYGMFSDAILPPVPEQRVCDLPSLELVSHWADVYRQLAPRYRAAGIEPYFWLCHTIGHGGELSAKSKAPFQAMVGASGEESHGCFCPLDPGFRQYLISVVSILAAADIPLILLDDDFRINYHEPAVDIGCFCPLHVNRFNEELGTQYTREELANRVISNSGNTRVQFTESVGRSMLELAEALEQAVHRVNPSTRLGLATAMIHYSTEGYDIRKMAKILAGTTRPYIRVFGAPYHVKNNSAQLGYTVDTAKHLAAYFADSDIEIIGEGDTFPHTRFFTNKTVLQTYLLSSRCAGMRNMLHYPFPFAASPDYEPLYITATQELTEAMTMLDQLLPENSIANGIAPVMTLGNFANIPISDEMTHWERVWPDEPVAIRMLTQFGIPTAPYRQADAKPVLIAGYNAYNDTPQQIEALLDHGAIIDATAAAWLVAKGYDIGLESVAPLNGSPAFELFSDCRFSSVYKNEQVWLLCSANMSFAHLKPKASALVAGYYVDGESGTRTPSCVAYQQGKRKVFVLGFDLYTARESFQAVNNVARAEQMQRVSQWLGVDVCTESPEFMYTNAYRQANTNTVCLVHTSIDPVQEISIYLSAQPAGEISFYNRQGAMLSNPPTYCIMPNGDGYRLRIAQSMYAGDMLILTYSTGQ